MIFESGPYLCVGADPHAEVLSNWGLDDSVTGLRQFTKIFLDGIAESVKVIKPQISLFESFGSQGFAVLEDFLAKLNELEKYVIADAKRSDIGSSMAGYAKAWLASDAPFLADAITVSPYLGVGALNQTFELALSNQKRVFVLVATSNPEARQVQSDGTALKVIRELSEYNPEGLGVVVGATVDTEFYGIRQELTKANYPVLAPGFGEQGASLGKTSEIFGGFANKVIANVSRSVLKGEPSEFAQRIDRAALEIR